MTWLTLLFQTGSQVIMLKNWKQSEVKSTSKAHHRTASSQSEASKGIKSYTEHVKIKTMVETFTPFRAGPTGEKENGGPAQNPPGITFIKIDQLSAGLTYEKTQGKDPKNVRRLAEIG